LQGDWAAFLRLQKLKERKQKKSGKKTRLSQNIRDNFIWLYNNFKNSQIIQKIGLA